MVPVGYRPILWHLMRYYAHYGHKEFILCLGYKADCVKKYFREYDETVSNDFVLSQGGRKVDLVASDIQDWKITFVDTGMNANIGQRLKLVQRYVADEEMFLANYCDGLSDLPLPDMISSFERQPEAVACFAGVTPTSSFHLVQLDDSGHVQSIRHIRACMDTFREKQLLEDMYTRGQVPWEVWKPHLNGGRAPGSNGAKAPVLTGAKAAG
jgi:glucose-1-phosphate cytidylyltransferase